MKTQIKLIALLACSLPVFIFAQKKEATIYKSDAFSVSTNQVVQGKFTAMALSPTELQSDYQSQTTAFKSPRISFKFSINGLDNEMLPGINHEFVCLGEKCETPLIAFGKRFVDEHQIPGNTYLKPNTQLKLRLDMRPVFDQFEKNGFYINYQGIKIFKADFKGVFVAGSIKPMVWDFDNLSYHTDLQLQDPDGDAIYELEMKINPITETGITIKTWKLTKDISAFPGYQSPSMLEKTIYNMSVEEMEKAIEKDSTLRTGIEWPGVWTRDVSYSIILSMAHMQPKVAQNSLMRKVNANGRIVQDTGTGGAWPVSTDRMIWAVAAWEIFKVTGDNNWLRKVYPIIKNSIEDDILVDHDPLTGLVKGESSFLDWREQTYPRWMTPVDIYSSKNLGTNALNYRALTVASRMAALMNEKPVSEKFSTQAAKIKDGINKYLWIPEKNYYGQYLYGRNNEILSPRSEALGEALCVVFDIATAARQKLVVQNTPVVDYGIPCIYPQIGDIPPYHNNAVWPFVQTYWMWAGAKAGNEKSVLHSIAAIYRAAALFLTNKENFVADNGDWAGTQINSSNMLWSLSGNISLVHKVLFGIRFNESSMRFEPFIPKSMAATRNLNGFKYRKALLDIEMKGYGNRIAAFLLDGKKLKSAVIPATLTGKHSVKILLASNEFEKQPIHLVKNEYTPLTPVSDYKNGKLSWAAIEGASVYRILKNGQSLKETTSTFYEVPATETGEFQVMAVDKNGLASFASEPVSIYPTGNVLIFETEKQLAPSTLSYQGYSGSGFVEISRTSNQSVTLDIDVPSGGTYTIDWRYSNGNGPTHTENKCAIRTLFVDGNRQGTQVFPQRGKGEWSNWGFSNAVKVQLQPGKHSLKLEFMPENENMNITINQAMLDYVRLIKVN